MATTPSGGMCRVTIVAPQTRVDLALPADVALADLLPTVLRYAGDGLADDPVGRDGWVLSRMGGPPLEADRSPGQLDVRDGDLLYLRPRGDDFAEPIFDDVVDAVATATQNRPGRWRPDSTRRLGLTVGIVTLALGAVMVLFSGPPQLPSAVVGLGVATLMLVVATVLARMVGDAAHTAAVVAVLALGYAGIGGLLLFAGDSTLDTLAAADVLIAGTTLLLGSALATAGVPDAVAVFLCTSIAAAGLCIGALICMTWGVTPAGAAAVVATLAFATLPAMPMLAYRLAGLPIPSVPSDREELRTDSESVAGRQVLALSERSDEFLGAMLGALALICTGAAVALISTGGAGGLAMTALLGLLMLTRARWFISRRQRLPLLVAGLVALGIAGVGAFLVADQRFRLIVGVGGALVLATVTMAYALRDSSKHPSPMWGRTLDIVEIVLILALIPLAMWVCGLYDWIGTIREG